MHIAATPAGLGGDYYRNEWQHAVQCVANALQCVERDPTADAVVALLSDPAAALMVLNECMSAAPQSEDARMLQLLLHRFVNGRSGKFDPRRFCWLYEPLVARRTPCKASPRAR